MKMHRELWRLGRELARLADEVAARRRPATKAKRSRPSWIDGPLQALGVNATEATLTTPEAFQELLPALEEAIRRAHPEDLVAIPALAWAAADVGTSTIAGEGRLLVMDRARDAATRFLARSESLVEPARSELGEIRGYCEAAAGGWLGEHGYTFEPFETLLDEAFTDELADAEGTPAASADADADAPSTLKTATPEHVVQMIVMHHICATISSLRDGSTAARFDGGTKEGSYRFSDGSESSFAAAWNAHGVVALAIHKYALKELMVRGRPVDLLANLPASLSEAAARIAGPRDRYTSAVWITSHGRHREGEEEHDGSAHLEGLGAAPRAALFGGGQAWAGLFGITTEQAELARALARRAAAGGGAITKEEVVTMLDGAKRVAKKTKEKAATELAKVGLRWKP